MEDLYRSNERLDRALEGNTRIVLTGVGSLVLMEGKESVDRISKKQALQVTDWAGGLVGCSFYFRFLLPFVGLISTESSETNASKLFH